MGKSRGTANSNAIQLQGRGKDPEELLWIAVLSKAADDALFTTKTNSRKKKKDKRMGRRYKTKNRVWDGKKSCHLVSTEKRKRKS